MSKNSKEPRLSILIVHYNDIRSLAECLDQIDGGIDVDYEVLIANNNPKHRLHIEEVTTKAKKKPQVIHSDKNIGFGSAQNILARKARAKVFFILNPDVTQISIEADTIKLLESGSHQGIIAPQVFDRSGNVERWSSGDEVTPLSTIQKKLLAPKKRKHLNKTNVGWVTGAAFFITKDAYVNVGGFDESFFLYFEDVDLCRRVREMDYEVCIDPSCSVTHLAGTSKDSDESQDAYYAQAQKYYFTKYYGRFVGAMMSQLRAIQKKY